MNAFELYEHVFDSAREEFLPAEKTQATLEKEVSNYAENALDLTLKADTIRIIARCAVDWFVTVQNTGGTQNDFNYQVKIPLQDIEV